MRKFYLGWRGWLLMVLAAVAMIGLFSVPADSQGAREWACVLIASKAAGIAAGYVFCRLTVYWQGRGLIGGMSEFMEED